MLIYIPISPPMHPPPSSSIRSSTLHLLFCPGNWASLKTCFVISHISTWQEDIVFLSRLIIFLYHWLSPSMSLKWPSVTGYLLVCFIKCHCLLGNFIEQAMETQPASQTPDIGSAAVKRPEAINGKRGILVVLSLFPDFQFSHHRIQ